MTINTSTHPKLLWPGIHAIWGQEYAEHAEEYTDLFDQLESSKAYEQDVMVTGFGLAPVKPETQGMAFEDEMQGGISTYMHIAYALGYIVSYEELQDNLYEQVAARRARANAFSMRQTIENVAAFLYNNATSTTYFTTWDSVALASASHVNAAGGSFSNILSPGADMSETALEDVCVQIMGFTNDKGLQINLMPRSLHVHRSRWFQSNRVLKSTLQSDTMSNNINVLRATNALPGGVKVNHYFNNAGRWFVRTNVPNGMQMFWRQRPMFDQDNDFDTKNAKAASYMRFSVGCTDPRAIITSDAP